MDANEEIRRLKALVQSFALVNGSLDLKIVLSNTLKTATKLMQAEIGSITLLNEKEGQLYFVESTDPDFEKLKELKIPLGKGIIGTVAQTGCSTCVEDIRKDSRFYQKIDQEMEQTTGSYICAPLIVHDRIIGTAQIMNHHDRKPFCREDVKLLEGFASQAALAIQNARIHALELEKKGMEHEMKLCSDIQKNIFPKSIPNLVNFEFYGETIPAKEVGGDYYNYFLYNKNCLDIILADVSGKGLSASLLVSQFHTSYQLLACAEKPLQETLRELNEFLYSTLIVGRFITAFVARLYADQDSIEYALAGHPPPIFVTKEGKTNQKFVRTGPILGFDMNTSPKVKKLSFSPGDILVSFSDGYSEAQNEKGAFFGEKKIMKIISESNTTSLSTIHDNLQKEVHSFCDKTLARDDMSIIMARRF